MERRRLSIVCFIAALCAITVAGTVDDLAVLASYWLEGDCQAPVWCDGADWDRSGHVNGADLAILASRWLQEPADLSNWMRELSDSVYLSQLSIPGTHNSGALYEPISGTAKCQSLTIGQQLAAGVRFLDIRCRHINNAFTIHHGMVFQNINFDDVLNTVFSFLDANPSECVIMSVKEEHTPENNSRSFEATFDSYVQQNPDRWFLAEYIAPLQQVRGKIVLLRRFGAVNTPKGIRATSWADNTTFWVTDGLARLRIQDYYNNSSGDDKWNAVLPILNEAAGQSAAVLYLNFTSGYRSGLFGIPSITTISNSVNPRVASFFTANTAGRYGIIVMDFVNAARSQLIVNTNFSDYAALPNGLYRLTNDHSGKVLSVLSGSSANGANVVQRDWANAGHQRWVLTHLGGGAYQVGASHSARMLAVAGQSTTDGANVEHRDWSGGQEQHWQAIGNSDGTYRLINLNSGLALTVQNASSANDASVIQSHWNNLPHQKWRIRGL